MSHDLIVRTPARDQSRQRPHSVPQETPSSAQARALLLSSSPLGSPEQVEGSLKTRLPDPSTFSSPEQGAGGMETMLSDPSTLSSPEQGKGGLKTMLPDPSPEQESDTSPPDSPEQKLGGLKTMPPDPPLLDSPNQGDGGLKPNPPPLNSPPDEPKVNTPTNSRKRGGLSNSNHSQARTPSTILTPNGRNHTQSSRTDDGTGSEEEDFIDGQGPLFTSATPRLTSRLESVKVARSNLSAAGKGGLDVQDLLSGHYPRPLSLGGGDPSLHLPPPLPTGDSPSRGTSFLENIQPPSPFQHAVFDLDVPDEHQASPTTTTCSAQIGEKQEVDLALNGTQPVTGSLIDFTTPEKPASSPGMCSSEPSKTPCGSQNPPEGSLPSYLYPSKRSMESNHNPSSQSKSFTSCLTMRHEEFFYNAK